MLYNSIPVAMYHHIAPTDKDINVYPGVFESHLRSLYNKGWKTLSGEEFLFFLKNKKERPRKCVLLTFDDGFADNYVYAYPLLKKFNMKAMLFIATDFIEDAEIRRDAFVPRSHSDAWKLAFTERRTEVMCTWKELEEMEKSGTFDIQSHGMSHKTPGYIKQKQYAIQEKDLVGGKALLEKRLSKKILHFAWPNGCYDREGIKTAERAGYKALYTTGRGANTTQNLSRVNRLPVKAGSGNWLVKKLPVYSSVLLSGLYLRLRTGR